MPINTWSDSILILELGDEPAFSEDMDVALTRLNGMSEKLPDVIIDAQQVSYLNSSNIAQLLKLRNTLTSAKAQIRLCACNDQVRSVLEIAGLDRVFPFTDDVSTALASLQMGG